ncbi:MAG: hypothetical protein AB7O96_01400 [Pseudobdellovibrionaceae bacterium]
MKSLLGFTLAVLISGPPAFGAEALSARMDPTKKNILIDVSYRGGCVRHRFTLFMWGCAETPLLQCSVQLIEITDKPDFCEAFIHTTAVIPLDLVGLSSSYYSKASLVIYGDNNSQATVILPKIEEKKSLFQVLFGQN